MARVALLLTAPAWRGSARSFGKIARVLRDAGHEVAVLAGAEATAAGLSADGVGGVEFLPLPDSGWRSTRTLAARWRRAPWSLLLADAPRDVRLAAGLPAPIAWRFNLPNRPVPSDPWSRWRFRRVRATLFQSAFAESVALAGAPWLARHGPRRMPNGYDTERLRPDPARGAAWRAEHGVAPETGLVLTAGALSPEKALPLALEATARVAATRPVVHVLAGEGESAAALRASAGPHVRWLGALPPAALLDAMRAADVVLQTSPREMFPNVVAEAMAVGRPVVAVAAGAAPEVTGDAGVLVPAEADALAAALAALLDDPARRSALGDAARRRIVERFPLAVMDDGYRRLVRDLLPPA